MLSFWYGYAINRVQCGYGCWLRCCWDGMHAGKIHKGCNKMRVRFYFLVEVLLLLPTTSVLKRREVLLFLFWWLRCCCSSLIERDVMKKIRLVSAFCLTRVRNQSRSLWLGTYCCSFSQPQVPAYNISTEAERGTGYCFILLRFCPLHCDASDVDCCCCSRLLNQ